VLKKIEANFELAGLNKAQILGINVFGGPVDRVITILSDVLKVRPLNRPFFVTTVNSEFVVRAEADIKFRTILQKSDLALADGFGLKLLGAGSIVPGRVLVKKLLTVLGVKPFYLGGVLGVAEEMVRLYGGDGEMGYENVRVPDLALDRRLVDRINQSGANLLLVAYGAPWQEEWISRNLDKLKVGIVIGVGGTFDFLTGRAVEPPMWIGVLGLEWAWRLILQPWRLGRQLNLIKYIYLILVGRLP